MRKHRRNKRCMLRAISCILTGVFSFSLSTSFLLAPHPSTSLCAYNLPFSLTCLLSSLHSWRHEINFKCFFISPSPPPLLSKQSTLSLSLHLFYISSHIFYLYHSYLTQGSPLCIDFLAVTRKNFSRPIAYLYTCH